MIPQLFPTLIFLLGCPVRVFFLLSCCEGCPFDSMIHFWGSTLVLCRTCYIRARMDQHGPKGMGSKPMVLGVTMLSFYLWPSFPISVSSWMLWFFYHDKLIRLAVQRPQDCWHQTWFETVMEMICMHTCIEVLGVGFFPLVFKLVFLGWFPILSPLVIAYVESNSSL